MRQLVLRGVRQNNLKDVDIDLPLGKAVIVTGPSGSGKSSLAFETVYAEGQRRYMQSLSTYARQFLQKFRAPILDKIQNVPPTIAIEQINPVRNSRATVGTTTELYDYLRLLFEKVGTEYCPKCNRKMQRTSAENVAGIVEEKCAGETVLVCARLVVPKRASAAIECLKDWLRSGYTRLVWKNQVHKIESLTGEAKLRGVSVYLVLDRISIEKKLSPSTQTRLSEAVTVGWELGQGVTELLVGKKDKYSSQLKLYRGVRCTKCGRQSEPKSSANFSFNSPLGACENCKGFGNTLELDENLVIPNARLSIVKGAIDPFTKPSLSHWQKKLLSFCKRQRIDVDLPYKELSAKHKDLILEGKATFPGVRGVFDELQQEKYKMRIRVFVSRYVSPMLCRVCEGNRLNESALSVKIGGETIASISGMTIADVRQFFEELKLSGNEKMIAADLIGHVTRRLDYLATVGIGYLTLSRLTKTLSGGEYQRILLATQLSQGLCDTLYVLDEPSIGLHPKDTQQLLSVLERLLELGNSLLVVEHDPEFIEWGQYIVDMGPGSGSRGGTVMFSGSRERFLRSDTRTAEAVQGWKKNCQAQLETERDLSNREYLELCGAAGNNLKKIDIKFPLEALVAVTGVSGSGKSTLVVDTLYQALAKIYRGRSEPIQRFHSISGFEHLQGVEMVDQSPIGRSSRSNPITFVKGYDDVRALFASTRDAKSKKLTPGSFSFNVAGGRCETCEGEGRVRVDMVFMEDVWIPCETCEEKRFKPHVLAVRYQGKNIHDCLQMTVDEGRDFFSEKPALREKLSFLSDVGLGYLQLGQPGYTLSGGEAQRIKIARELMAAARSYSKTRTLFILDEPTTGLHFHEIEKLLNVFRTLIKLGHSVVVIEHNVQVICASDFVIDLGPGGGEEGGSVVAVGTPKQLAEKKLPHTGRYLSEILNF